MATVAGLFEDSGEAHRAVEQLTAEGWSRDDVSIVARHPSEGEAEHENLAVKDAEKGAVVGGLAGLFLGLSELAVPGVGLVLAGGWLGWDYLVPRLPTWLPGPAAALERTK